MNKNMMISNPKMEHQINTVKELIQKATLEVKSLERSLIQLNRDEALTTSAHRIQETILELQKSQIKLSESELADALHYQKYIKETSTITQIYDSLLQSIAENILGTQKQLNMKQAQSITL